MLFYYYNDNVKRGKKMKVYNPYLDMTYDTKKKELIMSEKTLLTWLATWEVLADSQKENIKKVLTHLTRDRK